MRSPFFGQQPEPTAREKARFAARSVWLDFISSALDTGCRASTGGAAAHIKIRRLQLGKKLEFLGKNVSQRAARTVACRDNKS